MIGSGVGGSGLCVFGRALSGGAPSRSSPHFASAPLSLCFGITSRDPPTAPRLAGYQSSLPCTHRLAHSHHPAPSASPRSSLYPPEQSRSSHHSHNQHRRPHRRARTEAGHPLSAFPLFPPSPPSINPTGQFTPRSHNMSLAEPSSTITLGPPPPPAPGQYARNHRRSRSSNFFSDERTQGAFQPLPIPRRSSQRRSSTPLSVASLRQDSPSPDNALGLVPGPEDGEDNLMPGMELPADPSSVPFPSLGPMSPDPGAPPAKPVPPLVAPSALFAPDPRTATQSQSQQPTALPTSPRSAPDPPSPDYTPQSSPITLKNGRPLKPSLKSRSHSSPHLSSLPNHTRAISAPATPNYVPKNVHFAGEKEGLEHVVLFLREQRPIAVSHGTPEDTETETENDAKPAGYPFPRMETASLRDKVLLDPTRTSMVPTASCLRLQNETERYPVMLESLLLPQSSPLVLRGTVIVRNVSFHKQVAVRFTLDDWQTISEVSSTYVNHLPSLPPPFSAHSPFAPLDNNGWDRFGFQVRLEDYERKIEERSLFLVVRYSANGQDWWDNNDGSNYKVRFLRAPPSAPNTPSSAPSGSASYPSAPTPSNQAVSRSSAAPAASFTPVSDPPRRSHSFNQLNLKLLNYAPPTSPRAENHNLTPKASLALAKDREREEAAEKEAQENAVNEPSKLATAAAVEKVSGKKDKIPSPTLGAEFEAEKAERENKENLAPLPAVLVNPINRIGSPALNSPLSGSPRIDSPRPTAVVLPPAQGSPMRMPIPFPGTGTRRQRLSGTNSPSSSSDELTKLQQRRAKLAGSSGSDVSPRPSSPHLSLTDGSTTATATALNTPTGNVVPPAEPQQRRKLFTVEPMTPPSSSEGSPTQSMPSSPLQNPPPRLDRSERSYEEFLQKYCFFRGPNDIPGAPALTPASRTSSAGRGVGVGLGQVQG
ncbi:carbohydrate-binding module family 21 protein [Calocera viscosa TUFC12733]|uniref:Carbohydrate-binding module family 21 protein n=1 Tax=Calocera viscosa (strain TUFC12733) TaxID=1330018 RepID=A0A167JVV3_CALVF|nr:carbohydrate-binding module family 21 protein [Calocera viscosa TUFC12733]